MLARDWGYVLAAALLLVQAGCNRAATDGAGPGGTRSARVGPGVSGSGDSSRAAQPGTGLNGGLGPTQSMGGAPAGTSTQSTTALPDGSPNLTRKSSVGNR